MDSRPVSVLRAYGDFMGCVVEGGEQRVEFRFEPASFTWGLRISLVSLCAAVGWFVVILFWPKRRAANPGRTPDAAAGPARG